MGMKRRHKHEENHEAWLMTYADFITLMASFFVIIISISEPKKEKVEGVIQGLSAGFVQNMVELPFKTLFEDMQLIIEDNAVELQVAVEYTSEGVQLDLAASAIFNAGSAEIRPDSVQMLKDMAISIQEMNLKDFTIDVEGHTDDTPISGGAFASNWELSAARSARIVRFLIEQGIAPEKLKAVAYAETRPKAPNLDAQGNPIEENREQNRRVILQVKRVLY